MELSNRSMPDLYKLKEEIDKEIFRRRSIIRMNEYESYEKELLNLDKNDPGYQNWKDDEIRRGYRGEQTSLADYRSYKMYEYKQDQNLIDMGR